MNYYHHFDNKKEERRLYFVFTASNVSHLFILLYSDKYFLNIYYVPETLLGIGNKIE